MLVYLKQGQSSNQMSKGSERHLPNKGGKTPTAQLERQQIRVSKRGKNFSPAKWIGVLKTKLKDNSENHKYLNALTLEISK